MKRKHTDKQDSSVSKQNYIIGFLKKFTLVQLLVGVSCLLLLSSSSAYYLHRASQAQDAPKIEGQTISKVPSGASELKKVDTPKNETSEQSTNSSSQSQQQTVRSTSANDAANDEWLRRHDEAMRQKAIEDARRQKCDDDNNAAASKYSAAIDRARAAYNEVMAQWESVKNLPYYQRHPYDQYAADAKAKHNAISVPAYAEYSSTVSALKSQGCQVIQLYPDYSW